MLDCRQLPTPRGKTRAAAERSSKEKGGETSRERKPAEEGGMEWPLQANIKTNMFMIGRLRLHHRVSPDIWGPRKGFAREDVFSSGHLVACVVLMTEKGMGGGDGVAFDIEDPCGWERT